MVHRWFHTGIIMVYLYMVYEWYHNGIIMAS